jgi:hypothetical protein
MRRVGACIEVVVSFCRSLARQLSLAHSWCQLLSCQERKRQLVAAALAEGHTAVNASKLSMEVSRCKVVDSCFVLALWMTAAGLLFSICLTLKVISAPLFQATPWCKCLGLWEQIYCPGNKRTKVY